MTSEYIQVKRDSEFGEPSTSNEIVFNRHYKQNLKNNKNVDNNVNNVEFVSIKLEPDLSNENCKLDPSSLLEISKWHNVSVKEEPVYHSIDVEVSIKEEPTEDDPAEDVCNYPAENSPQVPSHIYIHSVSEEVLSLNSTVDGKYMCPICYKRFTSKGNVQRHMQLHTREKLECNVCFRQFVKKYLYERHLLTHSTEKRFKCEECQKNFRTSSNLEQHKKIHLVIKPFKCEKCCRQFAVKANLVKHQSTGRCKRSNDQPIVCTVCDKVFKREFLLKSHQRRHTTERPFTCDKCHMSFKYKSTLIRHVQLHNGIKPYSCKICRKRFTHAGLIKPHMRKHTGEKPYSCPVCNKTFAHKHNMQRHTIRHTKIKNLVCTVCSKTFPKESRLIYHMRTHTNAKPFVCGVCDKKFSHRQNIMRHYSRKHPNDTYDCRDTDASVAKDVWENVVKGEVENTFSFANPVYSPTATAPIPLAFPPTSVSELSASPSTLKTPRPFYKVEDVVFESPERPTSWRSFKRVVLLRATARAIYPYMVSIGLVYFTTLSLYPGIASEVPSCRLGSWMPIVLMCLQLVWFYWKTTWPYEWSRSQLLMASGLRLLLVPLLLLCAVMRYSLHIVGHVL